MNRRPAPRTGSHDLIRELNRGLLVNTVKARGPISRADLARQLGLSPATVSGIVAGLLRAEVLSTVAVGPSSGGRPPTLLRLNPSGAYVVGVKLRETGLTTVVTDLDAKVLHHDDAIGEFTGNPGAALTAVEAAVERVLAASGVARERVLGVGLGIGGIVDAHTGVCRYSHILQWRDVPIGEPLHRRLDLPVWVDNDVNTLAVSERWFGAGMDHRDFLTVSIGRGVGLGIIIDHRLYRGAAGGAGELGHVTADPGGRLCHCGRHGCLETVAAEPAIQAEAGRRMGRPVSMPELLQLASAGDPVVTAVLGQAGGILGRVLADQVALFNPELLVISGEGTRLGEPFLGPAIAELRRSSFAGLARDLEVIVHEWGDEAWAVGAAAQVLRELFSLPVDTELHRAVRERLAG